MNKIDIKNTKSEFNKAIEYFHFKQKFAKNKQYHNEQVNKLIKAYNILDFQFENAINKILNALILEVFFNFFKESKNENIALKKTIFILKNPTFTIDFYNSFLKTEILANTKNLQINLLLDHQNTAKNIISEILRKAKQSIIWS